MDNDVSGAPFWWPSRKTFIGILVIVALVVVVFVLLFFEPKGTSGDLLKIVLGALLAWGGMVFQFDYGSSEGSKSKDQSNADAMKALSQAVANSSPTPPAV